MLTTRDSEEQMQPPVQLGEELEQYDSKKMEIKGQIYHISQRRWSELRGKRRMKDIEVFMMSFQKLEKIEVVVMEEGNPPVRRWEDLNIDMLVKIFQSFDLFQLISSWKHTDIDLPLQFVVDNSQLTYIAKRCPRLKRLVMSAWEKLEKQTICSAFHEWKDVESLTMPSLEEPAYVIEKIGRSCKKLSELKIMTPCDILFASALVSFLPNLKVLSVRCTKLSKPALVILLDGLKKLKVLNISHCIITEDLPPPAPMKILTELDESILEKVSRLDKFLTCMSDSCIMCQRTRNDEGFMR
ncbi:hypothetical protein KY290_000708 [Solanum tuberosum]|uniref:F-box/LRR-repeat protein n=1 Tax=Solanum tuberosum TaxID=4113 RepID=A0ABQ7WMB0_SOLTU|nr:hypothetical protein KY290_000708 [Solanum tuberosum]